jgi:protein TonB
MLALALAAQMSLPVLIGGRIDDVRAVFSSDDFPAYLEGKSVSLSVRTATTVRPDGSVQYCVPEGSSGDATLDAYTCSLIVKRARFSPATWTDGSPVYGVIRVPVRWESGPAWLEDYSKRASSADMELSVSTLPKGAGSFVHVSLEIAADENGRPVTCAEWNAPDRKERRLRFPELVSIACQQVMANLAVRPAFDASDKSVRSIQSVSVDFKLDH